MKHVFTLENGHHVFTKASGHHVFTLESCHHLSPHKNMLYNWNIRESVVAHNIEVKNSLKN